MWWFVRISISSDVEKSKSACKGMQFLPFDTFYPILDSQPQRFFNPNLTWSKESQLGTISSLFNTSYSCHFSSSITKKYKAHKNLREFEIFTQLAYLQCPITYQSAPDIFWNAFFIYIHYSRLYVYRTNLSISLIHRKI